MRRHAALASSLFILGAFLGGCGHASDPTEVADAYRRAHATGDAEVLWSLSDSRFQSRVDRARLRTFLDEATLLRPSSKTSTVTMSSARISYADGLTLELVLEAEGWRVRAGGADPDLASTPLGALRRFLAAALGDDLEMVRRFMPASARIAFGRDEDLRRHLANDGDRLRALLRRLSSGPVEVHTEGEGAELRYAPGQAVRLVREDGTWRVLDLE